MDLRDIVYLKNAEKLAGDLIDELSDMYGNAKLDSFSDDD